MNVGVAGSARSRRDPRVREVSLTAAIAPRKSSRQQTRSPKRRTFVVGRGSASAALRTLASTQRVSNDPRASAEVERQPTRASLHEHHPPVTVPRHRCLRLHRIWMRGRRDRPGRTLSAGQQLPAMCRTLAGGAKPRRTPIQHSEGAAASLLLRRYLSDAGHGNHCPSGRDVHPLL